MMFVQQSELNGLFSLWCFFSEVILVHYLIFSSYLVLIFVLGFDHEFGDEIKRGSGEHCKDKKNN
jgi:hypothetical protein